MKNVICTLFFMFLGGQMAVAQSAGGGGGGDRPSLLSRVSNSRPIQIYASQSTCRQLNTALQLFGKLRLNGYGEKKPVFEVVFTKRTIPACNSRDITPYYTKTLEKSFCHVGYTCESTWQGR